MAKQPYEQTGSGGVAVSGAARGDRSQLTRLSPQFNGRAGEYFGIWFVNVLLSIVTFGIYSAWAKVRTERYFYANTQLAGSAFDYHAKPLAILKGRLIAFAVVATLGMSAQFMPLLYGVLVLALALAWPAIIVLALRFRARYSSWRGLHFYFKEDVGAAYGPFLGWQILTTMTATLLFPMMTRRQHEFVVQGHGFGQQSFRFQGTIGQYYRPYLIALGLGFVAIFVAAVPFVMTVIAAQGDVDALLADPTVLLPAVVIFYVFLFLISIMVYVRYQNLFWNNTRLGEHQFESSLRVRDMLWLFFSNTVAILLTLGLATPWAHVRLARYRAKHFTMLASGNLDEFVAVAGREHGAGGAELADVLDPGIEFGI